MKFWKYFNYRFGCVVKTFQVCTIREWLTQPRPLPLSLPSNAKPTPDLYWHSSPPLPFLQQVTLGVTAVVEPPGLVIAGVADIAWWDANFCLASRALCESDRDSSRRFTFPLRRLAAVLPPSEWESLPMQGAAVKMWQHRAGAQRLCCQTRWECIMTTPVNSRARAETVIESLTSFLGSS